jgi:lipoprotein-anchoring transpeptidase ErfK/SrfK
MASTFAHRGTRPRYGRIAVLALSTTVVGVSLLASAGGWGDRPEAGARGGVRPEQSSRMALSDARVPAAAPTTVPGAVAPAPRPTAPAAPPDDRALPPASGAGRRIVFDQSAQRVWLVRADGQVQRTYLGSGSVVDNLHPGSYAVYSRSRWAVGVDDSGVMQYFVRFTKGPGGAAIGFHTIPTKHGVPAQSVRQLGTPRSHGCIRQRTTDAIALWRFAPVGTRVVVVA